MGLLRMAVLGAAGYGIYKYATSQTGGHAAFARGEGDSDNFSKVRNSGPAAMADREDREWDKTDEGLDQTFPASDPPSTY
ncbi:hypothetical protein V5740_11815 [Croceibacterium sp. TMG7-5b_MA50]|uniref:hypothetical protein n=1 Tax=Croceibacterium sp. TMG7-5b_MA50 TaxID=3121290 RepID=UPI0032220895